MNEKDELLLQACKAGNLEKVKELTKFSLFSKQADIHIFDSVKYNSLNYAAQYGHLEIVAYLIEKGVPVDNYMEDHPNSLNLAAERGHLEVVELLLSKGAQLKKDQIAGPLHYAARGGNKAIVELLISKGLDMNSKSIFEKTPLDEASEYGRMEVVDYLKSLGAKGKAIKPDFANLFRYDKDNLEKILKTLRTNLNVKNLVPKLVEMGFKLDEENQTGAYFSSSNAWLALSANQFYQIYNCIIKIKGYNPDLTIPIVESIGNQRGRILLRSIYQPDKPIEEKDKVNFLTATTIMVFNKNEEVKYHNRYIYEKEVYARGLSPAAGTYFLKKKEIKWEASYEYMVVQTGEYEPLAAAKFGTDFGKEIFSSCFPENTPDKDWSIICGEQAFSDFAPAGYEISDYREFDKLINEIEEGYYCVENLLCK